MTKGFFIDLLENKAGVLVAAVFPGFLGMTDTVYTTAACMWECGASSVCLDSGPSVCYLVDEAHFCGDHF